MAIGLAVTPRKSVRGIVRQAISRAVHRILAFPLSGKIVGANALLIAAGAGYLAVVGGSSERGTTTAMAVVVLLASIVNVMLVRIALQPIKDLTGLANRVSRGDFRSRSTISPFADAKLHTLAVTVNSLLDSVAAEKDRIQHLGAEVMHAQDTERSKVSRELHDSIAQTLAAAKFQIAAASLDAGDDVKNRLTAVSAMIGSVTDDIRALSYSLHPRVAEDLGLDSAIRTLASQIQKRSGVEILVSVATDGAPIPANISATLYRVAEEALKNIEMHARAKRATVDVAAFPGSIRIEVSDEGSGFDPGKIDRITGRSGLASVKDRVPLAGGTMRIDSKLNGGTRVMAELKTAGATA
jgi:two-component system, NarL family, sensor histidine kinase UhpB